MALAPGILARGPWPCESVAARWHPAPYEPSAAATAAADAKLAALRDRDSPAHDGQSARLVAHTCAPGVLALELQPIRWALRLVDHDASQSVAAMCVVRSSDGRWLAGRRAAWLASWPGMWALGAGGSVDAGENPADTLARELDEEWSVTAERLTVEALICTHGQMILLLGMAWLAPGAEVEADDEHDAHEWWPADPARWPAEAHAPLRHIGALLTP